jgi:DNA-binding MarR family transcriptional regulator
MADYVTQVVDEWAEVRPDLDTSPIEVVLRLLRAAHVVQHELDAVASASTALSHKGDLDTLTALRRAGGSASPGELAAIVQLTSGGMTNRLDRLEISGLVRRSPAEHDRRAIVVSLTPEGRRVADAVFEASLEAQRRLVGVLGPGERDALARALERLLVHLGDEA